MSYQLPSELLLVALGFVEAQELFQLKQIDCIVH